MGVNGMVLSRVRRDAGAKPVGLPKYVSGTQNCAWLRAPWGSEDGGAHTGADVNDERYKRALSRLLKSELLYLNFNPAENCLHIKIRGGMIQDFGDCLVMESGTDREIAVMGKLIGFKKWPSVELSGTSRFREQATLESFRLGVHVLGCTMPEHLKAKLMGMKQEAAPVLPHVGRKKATAMLHPAVDTDDEAETQIQDSVDQYVLDMLSE